MDIILTKPRDRESLFQIFNIEQLTERIAFKTLAEKFLSCECMCHFVAVSLTMLSSYQYITFFPKFFILVVF